jgi:oxalate decarboxylase/phosphoglucose isomerase-like protein (cupin superfamily)
MHPSLSFTATALFLASTVLSAPQPYGVQFPQQNYTSSSSPILTPTTTQSSSQTYNYPAQTSSSSTTCATPLSLPDKSVFESLLLARSAVERDNLLSNDDLVYSFDTPCRNTPELGVTTGQGGKTVRADHSTFPALVGSGGSITIGFLNPCGFNTPHVHPRAAELNIVVEGRLFASVTAENGALHRNHTLNKFEMTVFPQGAIHTEFNPDCTPAVFVAAFPNEDPGVGQIAQNYFGLEDEIVLASAGGDLNIDGADIEAFRGKIPANVVMGVESCLAKCGIQKK